ncbi:hypothetical protein [Streptomyces althioticus]|uniref:hypothetical protein n=1 Tax=Streptomyces althioticus TaxID=83380 RepID=UPI0036FB4582
MHYLLTYQAGGSAGSSQEPFSQNSRITPMPTNIVARKVPPACLQRVSRLAPQKVHDDARDQPHADRQQEHHAQVESDARLVQLCRAFVCRFLRELRITGLAL